MPSEEQAVHFLEQQGGRRVDDGKFHQDTVRYLGRNGPLRGVLFEFPDQDTAREALGNLSNRFGDKKWTPNFDRISPSRIEFLGIAQSIGLEASLMDPGPIFGINRFFCYDETSGENLGVLQISATVNEGIDLDLLDELFTNATGHRLGYTLRQDDEFC